MKILLITGPLGSGKTWRLNQILAEIAKRKLTTLCIVNDVGTENIDAQRLNSVGEILPLTQGCVCCESVNALQKTLSDASEKNVDLIVIEPTGIADARVIYNICVNELRFGWSCLSLVDVLHFERNKAIGIEQLQLPVATLVGLSWTDHIASLEDANLGSVLEYVGRFTPAPIALMPKGRDMADFTDDLLNPKQVARKKTFSIRKHTRIFAKSIQFKEDVNESTLFPLLISLYQKYGLIRAKGFSFVSNPEYGKPGIYSWDFVQGAISFGDRAEGNVTPQGNFISSLCDVSEQLVLITKDTMCKDCDNQIEILTGNLPGVSMEDTINAIEYLLKQYPSPVTPAGQVLTNCEADPAKHLAKREGVPQELRERSYRVSVIWRIQGFKHLMRQYETGSFSDPYSFYRTCFVLGKALANTVMLPDVSVLMTGEILNEIKNLPAIKLAILGLNYLLEHNTKEVMSMIKPDSILRIFTYGFEQEPSTKADALKAIDHIQRKLKDVKTGYTSDDWNIVREKLTVL